MKEAPKVPAKEEATDTVFLSLDSEPLPAYPETKAECYARYRKAIDSLADQYWPHNMLLVSHQKCVEEAVGWGGKEGEMEAEYCAHVQLSRTSQESHSWAWKEDCGVYAYDSLS